MTKDLTHNLNLLADEVDPAAVDSHDIIDKARARTRNQRTGLASTLGVVAVAAAMAATIGLTGSDSAPGTRAGTRDGVQTTSAGGKPIMCDNTGQPAGQCTKPEAPDEPYQPDDRSRALDGQLAPVLDTVVRPRWQLAKTNYPMLVDVEAMQFARVYPDPEVPSEYVANALMSDAAGQFELSITVQKIPADTEFGPVKGKPFGPCLDGVNGCELRELADGTKAAAQADGTLPGIVRSSTLTAQRPDGTYIQLVAGPIPNGGATPSPFSNEDLFKFADVLTY